MGIAERLRAYIEATQGMNRFQAYETWCDEVREFLDTAVSTAERLRFCKLRGDGESWPKALHRQIGRLEAVIAVEEDGKFGDARREKATTGGDQGDGGDAAGRKVFIIHGHDLGAKDAVARFVEQIGLGAVVLQESAGRSKTIIEKFESHAADVRFAIALLTPDDRGGTTGTAEEPHSRARQNVIFELGYFVGKFGRGSVCILHKGEVDIPSDLHGIEYIPLDDHAGWQLRLSKELKAARLPVNSEALVRP